MSQQYFSVVTLLGQAKIAAALANAGSIMIAQLGVGDGNGAPVMPVVTQTGLVHEVWRGGVTSVARDPQRPTQVIVRATIPSSAGPATIRELALFASDGQCVAVSNWPATDIAASGAGAVTDIEVQFVLVVDTAAAVTVRIDTATLVPIATLLRAPWIAIDSFAVSPPANPAIGALVVVGAPLPSSGPKIPATGAFTNLDDQFAQWDGETWRAAPAPVRTVVGNAANSRDYRRTPAGWIEVVLGDRGLENIGSTAGVGLYQGLDPDNGKHEISKIKAGSGVTVTLDPDTKDVVIAATGGGTSGGTGSGGTGGTGGTTPVATVTAFNYLADAPQAFTFRNDTARFKVQIWGAGALDLRSQVPYAGNVAGPGGYTEAEYTRAALSNPVGLQIVCGNIGTLVAGYAPRRYLGGGAGYGNSNGGGLSGAGLSGAFLGTPSQANALAIAGGGGAMGDSYDYGGTATTAGGLPGNHPLYSGGMTGMLGQDGDPPAAEETTGGGGGGYYGGRSAVGSPLGDSTAKVGWGGTGYVKPGATRSSVQYSAVGARNPPATTDPNYANNAGIARNNYAGDPPGYGRVVITEYNA